MKGCGVRTWLAYEFRNHPRFVPSTRTTYVRRMTQKWQTGRSNECSSQARYGRRCGQVYKGMKGTDSPHCCSVGTVGHPCAFATVFYPISPFNFARTRVDFKYVLTSDKLEEGHAGREDGNANLLYCNRDVSCIVHGKP